MLWRSCPAPNVGGDPFNIHQQAVDKELRKHFSLSDKDIRTAAALAPEVVFPRPPVWTAPPPGPWSAGSPEPPKNAAASSRRNWRRTGLSQRGSLRLPPPDQEKYPPFRLLIPMAVLSALGIFRPYLFLLLLLL